VTTESLVAHNTLATAQPLALPGIVTGSIATSGEIDAYKLTVPANAVLEFTSQGQAPIQVGVPADQTGLVLSANSDTIEGLARSAPWAITPIALTGLSILFQARRAPPRARRRPVRTHH
jgi:hypothetical protein